MRSPELAALVPVLLGAIADPQSSTRPCLDALLGTTFAHTLDAPSLALLVPVLHRGLRDRGGDTKKRAARIVGSMAGLTTDAKVRQRPIPLYFFFLPLGCLLCARDAVLHAPCAV